ncbi:MAG: hypothetical protein ACXVCV_21055, partial [Polyangia bacterium]
MRWMRAALLICAATTACRFSFVGVDSGVGSGDDMSMGVDLAGDLGACGCATGCSTTTPVHCLGLAPSGPVVAGDYGMAGLVAVNVNANITIDTDTGAIMGPAGLSRPGMPGVVNGIGYHVVTQASGPSVGVFSVAGLTLVGAAKITIKGTNAFALASAGSVSLGGIVDASCSGPMPGPGGFAGGMSAMDGSGPAAGAGKAGLNAGGPAGQASGGGGAGYGDSGGSGGLIATQTTPNGGVAFGDLTTPTFTLTGGPGGGGGGQPMGGKGGGGGGAVQISVNGTLTVSGTINVGGCGGLHGAKSTGGGGGGAGGAIVLEATHVTLASTAVLAANGGGGAAGDDKSTSGFDANASVLPALGGTTASTSGGNGGNGGASNGLPGQHFTNGRNGTIPDPANDWGGGG